MRKFYQLADGQWPYPDFHLPQQGSSGPIPLIPEAWEEDVGNRLEAILAAVDGLKVCNAISLLEVAKKALMQCPVNSKEQSGPF